jgi:hypothetical protein
MTLMLVSYDVCGCRVDALLDASDLNTAAGYRDECEAEGRRVAMEQHERIGVLHCRTHQVVGCSCEGCR